MSNTLTSKRRKRLGPNNKLSRGYAVPVKRIIDVNDMYWEQGMSRGEIRKSGTSETVMDRALFQTRAEWEKFKREN